MSSSKADALISHFLPALLQSVGLPPIPLTLQDIKDLKGTLSDTSEKRAENPWQLISHIEILSKTPDRAFKDIVMSIIYDQEYQQLSPQIIEAMIAVGRKKAISAQE